MSLSTNSLLILSSGSTEILRREQQAHADHLRRWFSSRQFAPQQLLRWANRSFVAVTLATYWEGLQSTDGEPTAQVDGAYTLGTWTQSFQPFLQRAGDAVPDMKPRLDEFQRTYRAQYVAQWRQDACIAHLVNTPRRDQR